jgi:hypothetical protein
MSDSNDLKPTSPAATPVPDLIEQYRLRRDAWIAQADELARLRDEVRGSAEREAMEIVTAARRDVRQIVMEARRELLVLSAQVQAALGDAAARPDQSLLNRGRDVDGEPGQDFSDTILAPEDAVKGMLDEARADMDALVDDARTVPFQALAEPLPIIPPQEPPVASPPERPFASPQLPPPSSSTLLSTTPVSPVTSRVLLSSPFPSDAVPVPAGSRARMFVALFGVAGIAVLAGTIWWLRSDTRSTASEPATASTATAPAAPEPATPSAAAPADAASTTAATPPPTTTSTSGPAVAADTPAPRSALSLLVEARRSSWLRTTVDGQSDTGRMLAQGETVRLRAQQSVSLRVGDAGAVFVSVNNGQPSPLGRDGQVVTRQFVVENADRNPGATSPQLGSPQSPPATPTQKPGPLSGPIASGPPTPVSPAPAPLPIVQPVAATPSSPPLEPGPSPTPRAETTPPPAASRPEPPTAGPASPASAVIAASRQWLDAYHRQDRAAMASLSMDGLQLTDERRTEERFPASASVNRTLDRVSVQIAADTAVLTAIMTERSPDNVVPPRISPISQVWELRGNQWRVRQVRLVSEARLNQIFR